MFARVAPERVKPACKSRNTITMGFLMLPTPNFVLKNHQPVTAKRPVVDHRSSLRPTLHFPRPMLFQIFVFSDSRIFKLFSTPNASVVCRRSGADFIFRLKIPPPRSHLAGVTSTTLLQPLAWSCDTAFCASHNRHASHQNIVTTREGSKSGGYELTGTLIRRWLYTERSKKNRSTHTTLGG